MDGKKHHQQHRVKGSAIVVSPTSSPIKTPPVHNSRGNTCNVVENCGKTALRFHGRLFGCKDHEAAIFTAAAKSRGIKIELPQVDFEPEETGIAIAELA